VGWGVLLDIGGGFPGLGGFGGVFGGGFGGGFGGKNDDL
jgi:hypothetical protein